MRKIEALMLDAVKNRKNWTRDNMAVFFISANESGNPHGSRSEVYLHGHLIAEWWHHQPEPLAVNTRTLEQWPTNTTKSRLRALGANVTTHKGITYLNDQAIN